MKTFIAIELPGELKEKISAFSEKIAKNCDIKLVEKENLHLTLVFLGEMGEEETSRAVGGIGNVGGVGRIRLRLGKVEVFPDEKRPHGIWINVEGEREKLFALYKNIVDLLLKAGIKLKERQLRFLPHITIGRFRGKVRDIGPASPATCLTEARWERGEEIGGVRGNLMVEKITFFQSQLSAKGPRYIKIGEFEVK